MWRRPVAALHGLLFRRTPFEGLELYFEPSSLARMRESLQLVKDGDPLRWRRLARDMPLMVETWGGSSCNHLGGIGFIDVGRMNSWRLAGVIVHELTHAHLHARWSVPYRGELKQWHEMLCLKEELRLYRRFIRAFDCDEVEGKQWLASIERYHRRALERRWWEYSRWNRFVRSWRAFQEREAERKSTKLPE